MILYADVLAGRSRVMIAIKKMESSELVEISHDDEVSRAALFEQEDAEKLFRALLVREMNHGNYVIKTLVDEQVRFSVSCMKDVAHGTGTSCQVLIFKNGLKLF